MAHPEQRGSTLVEYQAAFLLQASRYVVAAGLATVIPMFGLWAFFREYVQFLLVGIYTIAAVVGGWWSHAWVRQGRHKEAGLVLLVSSFLTLFCHPILFPSLMPAIGVSYVLLILLAYLFLDDAPAFRLTGAIVVGFVVDIYLSQRVGPRLFRPVPGGIELSLGIVLAFFLFSLVAMIARAILRRQSELYEESQRVALEVERRAAAEREDAERVQAVLQEYIEYMEMVEQGDMSRRLTLEGKWLKGEDEPLIVLGHGMNRMVAAVQRLLHQIRSAAADLRSFAGELLSTTAQQAAGASQQSAAISQTTTTVDELKMIAEQSVTRAQEVADAARRTVEVSRGGRQAVQETIGSMVQIKARVEGIAENILALAEQTQQIGEIIATVNEIAAQSNMLALNASIEAARAGEAGKGFAVVAGEVRRLAEQSRQATAQVKAILSDIQRATNATVMATEEGTKRVEEGMRLARQAGEAIEQLAGVIEESAQAAAQLVAGGRQQATGVEQVALAMQSINQATRDNLASTRAAEKTARSLNELARTLSESVEHY